MRRSLLPRPAPWAKWSLLPYTFLTAVAAVGLGWWLYGNWVRHPYLLFGLLVCGIAIAHQRWGIRALLIVATTTYFAKRLEFYVYRDNASEFNNPVSLLPEIVLVVLFLSVMLEVWARSGRLSLARSALNLTIVAYFFWALLETANPRSSLVVGLYGFRASALYVLAAFIGQYIFEREQQIYRFMRFSIGLAVIVALYGLWQQISAVPEWDRQWFLNFFSTTQYSWMAGGVFSWEELRKFATLKSPTSAGYFYTIHIAFALTFFLWRRKIIDLLAIAILSAALFFTYVRGAWLSCAVVLLVIVAFWWLRNSVKQRGWALLRIFAVAIGVLLAGALLLHYIVPYISLEQGGVLRRIQSLTDPFQASEFLFRASIWKTTLPLILRNPIGYGIGSTGQVAQRFAAGLGVVDNLYFKLAVELGWVGLGLFLLIAWFGMRNAWSLYTRSAHSDFIRVFAICAISLLLLTMINGLVGPLLEYDIGMIYFWLWLGITDRLAQRRLPRAAIGIASPTVVS